MFLSGIADEAGKDIDIQIKAHQELGWKHIEMRLVGGKQFTDLTDDEFEQVAAKLDAAGMQVSCFASPLANWATKITNPPEDDIAILERAIPRMQKLGTKFIRVMSWENDGLETEEWRDQAVSRMKALAQRAADGGVILALENCGGYTGQSAENYASFFPLVDSPALKAVYDTGNPAGHGGNTWDWYLAAKPHIVYVHIKSKSAPQADGASECCFPDEGVSLVLETLKDLAASGYDGGISIEPHMKAVIHMGRGVPESESAYETYIEYGRRTMQLVEQAQA